MAGSELSSPIMASLRLGLYVAFTLPMMLIQILAIVLRRRAVCTIPVWYHRQCCKIMGIRVERRGQQSQEHPTLYLCNHVSYMDITILGSLIVGSFVAKAEVKDWPLYGWLARLQRSVFVERRAQRSLEQRDELGRRLEEGDSLILFPEGTSGDGNRILPFKSALLSVAERRPGGKPLPIQPVTIAYTKLDGLPLGRYLRPFYAWYGDMEMASHLWQMAGLGRLTVVVHFHPMITLEELGSRKALATYTTERVQAGLTAALTGRPLDGGGEAIEEQPETAEESA